MTNRKFVLVGVPIAAILAVAVAAGAMSVSAATQDANAVRAVVTGAMLATQQLPAMPETNAARGISQSVDAMLGSADATLEGLYAGDVLALKEDLVKRAIEGRAGAVVVEAGVTNIAIISLRITGDRATVEATGLSWARMTQALPSGPPLTATPQNEVDWKFELAKANGRWLIDTETWAFAPGSET